MAIIYGKDRETDYASGNLAPIGKSYSRMGAAPLDMYEVWYDKEALIAYASNLGTPQADGSYDTSSVLSYVGQKVAYVDEQNKKIFHYSIELDGTLKEIGNTFLEGTLIDISAANAKGEVTISHEKVAAPVIATGTGRTYITSIETDGYGHITKIYTATEKDQEVDIPAVLEGTYIDVAVNDDGDYVVSHENAPTLSIDNASTYVSRFVTGITRDAQGHITGYKTEQVLIPDVTLDNVSIDRTTDGKIQIKDFAAATTVEGNIPRVVVKDGKKTIEWVTVKEAVSDIKDENTVTTIEAGNDGVEVELISQTADEIKYQVSHAEAPTTGSAATGTAGTQGTYVTEVIVDEYGHVAGVKTAVDKDEDTKYDLYVDSTTVESPSSNPNGGTLVFEEDDTVKKKVEFVGGNGIYITATNGDATNGIARFVIDAPDVEVDLAENEDYKNAEIKPDTVPALVSLTPELLSEEVAAGENPWRHHLEATYVNVPTKEYVDRLVTGATDYLGTVNSQAELDALKPKRGDFVRVATAFGTYHVSDMLICETPYNEDNPDTPDNETELAVSWSVIHGEIDANTWVANTKDADGYVTKGEGQANKVWKTDKDGNPGWRDDKDTTYSFEAGAKLDVAIDATNKVTYSHETITTTPTTAADKKITFVSGITTDGYGHTTGYETAEVNFPAPVDISGKMDLAPEATTGHYAIFDDKGQVIDGGRLSADVDVQDLSEDNDYGYMRFKLNEHTGTDKSRLWFEQTLKITKDSGLTISSETPTESVGSTGCETYAESSIALSEATKASLAKADAALPANALAACVTGTQITDSGRFYSHTANGETNVTIENAPLIYGATYTLTINGETYTATCAGDEMMKSVEFLRTPGDTYSFVVGLSQVSSDDVCYVLIHPEYAESNFEVTYQIEGLGIERGAQVNYINAVNDTQFTVTETELELAPNVVLSLQKADAAVQTITTIDTSADHTHGTETNCGGLKAVKTGSTVNIEIDDSITFILNCGSAADL